MRTAVLGITLALACAGAQAQSTTYRCVGKDGKKYYGQSVPPQCAGVTVEQVSASGSVMRRIEPQASVDDQAKKAAEEAERKKQAGLSREQQRRDQALLATYASEKDVEDMRRRALEGDQQLARDLEAKIAALRERRAGGKDDPKAIDMELDVNQRLLAAKRKEIDAINAKYDDEKKRYLELTAQKK